VFYNMSEITYFDSFDTTKDFIERRERELTVKYIKRTTSVGFGIGVSE